MKQLITAIVVFLFYALLIGFVYSLGSHFLADGWDIDSSEYRVFLYRVEYALLPLLYVVGGAHFLCSIVGKDIFVKAFMWSLLLGLLGPAFLVILISLSSDPEAAMGYLALGPFYAVFFLLFLVILIIVFFVIKIYKKTNKSR